MAHEVVWTESAVASLVDAVEYIARDSPSYAGAFAVRPERAAASLKMFPERGRRVPEFNDPAVIYRVARSTVILLAFVHKARDLAGIVSTD